MICLNGSARVSANGESFELVQYDAVYVPRDSQITVEAGGDAGCDLAEVSAPVAKRYPTKLDFLWMMAAIREGEDRLYGVVNVQPEYAAGGSGLEAVSDKK